MRLEVQNQERPYVIDLPCDYHGGKLDYQALRRWAEKLECQIAVRDAEIEAVAKELEALADEWSSPNPPQARGLRKAANLLRTCLLGKGE